MSAVIRIKRRINGIAGSPGAGVEGELAINAPGAAGSNQKPVLFFHDGSAWRTVNPDVNITTQSVLLPTGANIGAAYTTWTGTSGNAITGNVVIATYGTPAQAYVLTNPAHPENSASWTSLGGAVTFALATEIVTGTDTLKAINPAGLRGASRKTPSARASDDENYIPILGATGALDAGFIPKATTVNIQLGIDDASFITPAGLQSRVVLSPDPAGTPDARKIPLLGANGKIPAGFLSAGGLAFRSGLDLTIAYAAPTPAPKAGDFFTVSKAGTVDSSWATHLALGAALTTVAAGDMLVWDDTAKKFHHIANNVSPNAYVTKAGTSQMAADAKLDFATNAPAAGSTILDGGANFPILDNVTVNAGTY